MTEPNPNPWTLTARWVFPVDGGPLEGGTVTVRGERIEAVEPAGRRRAEVDLGEVAVLPGLVNAHTHLDLTGLRGLLPPTPDFTAWLKGVIRHRRSRPPEQVAADVRAGLDECLRFGTTLLGDISGDGGSWEVLAGAPVRALVFRELLGLTPERIAESTRDATIWLQTHRATPTCRPGLSPHAPYSTHQALYRVAALLAGPFAAALATHLAETAAELELLAQRSGPFVAFLQELGVWNPDGLLPHPTRYIRECGPGTRLLLAHGNYLPAGTVLPPTAAVVYCPRTHAAFGHPPHPFRDFLSRGIGVALGTDSLASNPDLDVLAEARFLRRQYPDLPGDQLLRMATLAGAKALGWADETGSLTPGKSADLVAVPLAEATSADPHERIWAGRAPVGAVLCRGAWASK